MRVAILGGSFDPVHLGHLGLARAAQKFLGLHQVVFMIAPRPPHKGNRLHTDAYHRFAMVSLALQEEEQMVTSTFELDRPGPSYTVELLDEWTHRHPEQEVCFLAGGDSLQQIHLWKDCVRLLEKYSFVFVGRRGARVELDELHLESHLRNRIQVCVTPQPRLKPGQSLLIKIPLPPPVSSSSIRSALAQREAPDYLDPAVLSYIRKHHLYE